MSRIINIDNILVSEEIITECFSCDYEKCNGACCIIGDSGAPLLEEECEAIEKEYSDFSSIMSEEGRKIISEKGFFEIDSDGDIVTPLVGQGGKCAYTCIENGHCYCSMERSYIAGRLNFKKPISCWLYPIRVSTLKNGQMVLNLHRWHICAEAFLKGRREHIPVYVFLREPLIHLFGEEFYKELSEAAKILTASSKSLSSTVS